MKGTYLPYSENMFQKVLEHRYSISQRGERQYVTNQLKVNLYIGLQGKYRKFPGSTPFWITVNQQMVDYLALDYLPEGWVN